MTDIGNRDGKRPDTQKPYTQKPDTRQPDLDGGKQVGGAPDVPPPPPSAVSSASSGAPAPVRAREGGSSHGTALLAQDERDKLTLRLQHAVTGFVDGPQESVEEADRVLEEVTERLTEAVARSRRTVRATLQSSDGKDSGDTERLRLAMRDYRELAERLLHS
ncbi:hypothetical protein PV396_16350 [Streptomyces sp. ME02-8801-2C]|uniref:hypothetical protein n=1 Tax=Streptomyces sp. ME02-8801-2C TaxID=3028680 RepID=UPI0029B1A00F|nr:hypothetical protein [Streptomyces sp. ME02-8801-2C]MDX3453502.1 hypothetical protein [Streptomyces sp. ME02-8801-2C]